MTTGSYLRPNETFNVIKCSSSKIVYKHGKPSTILLLNCTEYISLLNIHVLGNYCSHGAVKLVIVKSNLSWGITAVQLVKMQSNLSWCTLTCHGALQCLAGPHGQGRPVPRHGRAGYRKSGPRYGQEQCWSSV